MPVRIALEDMGTATEIVRTICPYCGVGCGMGLRVREGKVAGVEPLATHPVSHGELCAKGWSAAFGVDTGDRITVPLIKEHGKFRQSTWDEALRYVADTFSEAIRESGPDSVGVISCARATNEDNYAAQKFARSVLGTNNVDHCARICHSPSVAGLRQTLGSGAMTSSIADLYNADLIVVWGSDTTENHSIIGSHILRAKLNGAKLLVVDPRQTRLAHLSDLHLQCRLGTNIALVNGLLNVIFRNGWENREFIEKRCDNSDLLRHKVAEYPPERASEITGVPVAQIEAAARLYSHAKAAWLCYGMGITQHTTGTSNVIAISDLALACGHVGRPGSGINPLRGQNNVQGACDMGALPNVYPGYLDTMNPEVQQKVTSLWGCKVPTTAGMTSLGMTQSARDGKFKCLIIMGEDPVVTDPDQNHVRAALRALDLLVVFELTLTETAKEADVIFPAASFAEKDGTFTNCERRVQRVRAAVPPPGECKPDWMILGELARRMGSSNLNWKSAREIFQEMATLSPIHAGMDFDRLSSQDGIQWPCNDTYPEGLGILHQTSFPIGKGRMIPVDHHDPAELPDKDYPYLFTTNRLHFHYGCGSMTRKSPLLERETPDGLLFIHPSDAANLGVKDHSPVRITSRRGAVETRTILTEDVPPGTVVMPYHFKEAPSNQVTNNAQDPVTKMPELKVCAVQVESLPAGHIPKSLVMP